MKKKTYTEQGRYVKPWIGSHPKYMFIGIMGGKNGAYKTGVAFTAPDNNQAEVSARILHSALYRLQIPLSQVIFDNIVRKAFNYNRDPTKEEIEKDIVYVQQLIKYWEPQLERIITLGNIPTQALFGCSVREWQNVGKYRAMYHPAYYGRHNHPDLFMKDLRRILK